jgi:hypothetical protein
VITYPEIAKYDSIEDLFGKDNRIVLLYVNEINGSSVSGHWVLLTRVKRNGKTLIEFNDSYGLLPDAQLDHYSDQWKRESQQTYPILTKLLHDFSLKPNNEVHYNQIPFQTDSPNINTCGRHCAIRGHFYKVPLEKYQQLMGGLKRKGFSTDEASVLLSNRLL